MPAVTAVIFDLLTALIDSWSLWDAVAGGEAAGRRWRAQYLDRTFGCGPYRPYETLVAEAARAAGLPDSVSAALRARWDELAPWPEAPEVIAALRAKTIKLGVVTNCSIDLGRRAASRFGDCFDAVVTAEEAGFYKPRSETYAAGLAALGAPPEETLFVAGSSGDVGGAANAGMRVVWHNRVGLEPKPGPAPLREARTLDSALAGFV